MRFKIIPNNGNNGILNEFYNAMMVTMKETETAYICLI